MKNSTCSCEDWKQNIGISKEDNLSEFYSDYNEKLKTYIEAIKK